MPRGSTYANNSYNRSLGRVGAPMGSMPVSRSSSGSSGMSGSSGSHSTYVDNSYNRSLGRVGAPLGSMPASRSSSGSSGISGSSGSHSTYVDNSYNRSLGRVGAPLGSMPASRSSSGSSGMSGSSGSHSTYVDNSYNRSVGRVGMPLGSMPVSKSSSASASNASSSGTYVNNDYNRKAGRVGMPLGSMPISKSSTSSSDSLSNSGEGKVYKDNALNRRLGRVGLPLGSAPHSRKSGDSKSEERVYVNNDMNRRLGRVGKRVGTMVVSKTQSSNSRKKTQPTHPMKEMLDELLCPEADGCGDFPTNVPREEQEYMSDMVLSLIRRMDQVLQWQDANQTWGKQPHTARESVQYANSVIEFEEIQLEKKIGQGGFGDVYFAKWRGTVVAVKKLRLQRVPRRRLKQFQDEVKILNRLDHPRIVKFIGACVVTPNLAIVMEYMQESLYEALHVEEKELSDKEQHQIVLHMAEGLAYLHEKSVAHCDMKSTNILLDKAEDGILAKISDFGLSMMKSETETSQSEAKVVQGVGTPKYSAPEVLSGEDLDLQAMYKADVYSMSVVAWEVICQEVPFFGLNVHQLKRRVLGGDVNLQIPDDITIGKDLLVLLKECWCQDPNKRPSSQTFEARVAKLQGIK